MKILKFIIALGLPLTVGGIAGFFTSEAIPDWYASLNQPSFNPPNYLFGPVWTVLYLLMGYSFYLIWLQKASKEKSQARVAFFVQLFLNFCWSFLFFYFQMIGAAFVEIIILWLSIIYMMVMFYKIKPVAAYLNIPYILWVSFATVLNGTYYFLN